MQLTTTTRHKLTTSSIVILVIGLGGSIYPFLLPFPQRGGPAWHSHLIGFLAGVLIGLALSFGEYYLFQTRIRRLRFSLFILVQTLYYVVTTNIAVIGVTASHYVILHGRSIVEETRPEVIEGFFKGDAFLIINAYALAMIMVITFIRQMSRMLGQNALLHYLTGRYHKPVEEERVFMFLDLKDSTSIAEKLGHTRYHGFLNDFFYDITPAIIDCKGEIYQYVGDEVVVTWTMERGLQQANCINCYFGVVGAIAKASGRYEKRYGFVPTFKAGYHAGRVIAGLIGDIKRDVVFHGDTVNTAARIRSECMTFKRNLLLSGSLLEQLPISNYLTAESMGRIKLRGKEEEIELYSIKEAA